MTHRQPDPAPGAEPERGFVIAVLAQGEDPEEELASALEPKDTLEPAGTLMVFTKKIFGSMTQ